MSVEFAYPWAFALLALLPLLWWRWSVRRARPTVQFSDLFTLRAARASARLRLIPPVLRSAALIVLTVALARPQQIDVTHQIYAEGIAIQMVVDVSGSMQETDMSTIGGGAQTRLDVVKDVFRRFVAVDEDSNLPGRPNDLIGMIRFASYPDSVCPLTLDHQALLDILAQTETVRRREESQTAIGDGLALAVERLKDVERTSAAGEQYRVTSRVVILLTDGEDNASVIPPREAADLAASFDIKVYTILVGAGRPLGFMRVPTDDRDLRYIADTTGGRHYRATDGDALEQVYADIDELERTRTEEKRYVRREDRAAPWLLAALVCIGLQTLLESTRLRRIP